MLCVGSEAASDRAQRGCTTLMCPCWGAAFSGGSPPQPAHYYFQTPHWNTATQERAVNKIKRIVHQQREWFYLKMPFTQNVSCTIILTKDMKPTWNGKHTTFLSKMWKENVCVKQLVWRTSFLHSSLHEPTHFWYRCKITATNRTLCKGVLCQLLLWLTGHRRSL